VTLNNFSTGVLFDLCTVREIGVDGVTVGQAEASPGSPVAGVGTPTKPNQVAVVITLISTLAGRRGRGRIFLPILAGTMGATGRMGSTQRDSLADTADTLVTGVGQAMGARVQADAVSVQSQVVPSSAIVTSIRVGDVFDTQRRRRDNLIESYTSRVIS
jgi:hypothetical protein